MANAPERIRNLTVLKSGVELLRNQGLGAGPYGKVFKAKYRGSLCAAKEIHSILIEYEPKESSNLLDNFLRECYLCNKFDHPNIVHCIGIYYPHKQSLFLVKIMELMDETLHDYAKKRNISFSERVSILHDVAEGLNYIHSCSPPVIYCDLTPNNVLVKHLPEFLVAKIGGFCVAHIINDNGRKTPECLTKIPGTTDFMPPESFEDRPQYDTSLDIFSYGGVILHTVNGIWPKPTCLRRIDAVTRVVRTFTEVERRQEYLDKMTGEANKILRPLVEACLNDNPADRPSTDECM